MDQVRMGPRTLDLSGTSWCGARLVGVRFSMARLVDANFTGATLKEVHFANGLLHNASFRGATLHRVSFEGAELQGADFTGAVFRQMHFYGEPNYAGATIPDELRYQFGELREPMRRVDAVLADSALAPDVREALVALRERHGTFLQYPEIMLIGDEVTDAVPPAVFPRLLAALKRQPLS